MSKPCEYLREEFSKQREQQVQSQKINGKENISAFLLEAINKVVDVITIGEKNIVSNLGMLLKNCPCNQYFILLLLPICSFWRQLFTLSYTLTYLVN